jgi:hypothetical protein
MVRLDEEYEGWKGFGCLALIILLLVVLLTLILYFFA